ncbi:glycosyltransferase family 2 protein [Mycoplasma sp. ATU-Cv-703]|uniref:glycosyltransferase n=1 Tax=Mycoplasma sp. ATU-Cv-703 TaxID=2498595 RepID=UPI001374B5CB
MSFTVIVPAYNAVPFISKTLRSLEQQTYQNFEVLIIDDGSTDGLKTAVEPFLDKHANWRYFRKPNGNWGSVINYVLQKKLVKNQYVTILDSDDWFVPRALELVNQQLVRDPTIDVLITKLIRLMNGKQRALPVILFKSKYISAAQARSPLSTPHGKFYRRELFYQLPKLREKVSYQDTILFNYLISKAKRIYYLGEPLVVWWVDRPGNSTQAKWDQKRVDLWLDNIEEIDKMDTDREVSAYALMYLWELRRRAQSVPERKAKINTRGVRFKWIPWYIRMLFPVKTYFRLTTRKYRAKPSGRKKKSG